MLVTIFRNIKEINTPFHLNIEKIFERIQKGNSKELCEKIRNEKDKKLRNEFKKDLPSILFSGNFNNRKQGAEPIEHSGYIVIDIDDIPLDKLESGKVLICQSEYIYACFLSPSGNGFKVIVKIPKDIKRHGDYFRGIEAYFANALDIEVDTSGKNINRVCYESYDPEIYINDKALLFTDLIEDVAPKRYSNDLPTIPVTDVDEIQRRLITWWQKNYTYVDGQKHHSIIALAGAFNRYGVSYSDALRYCNSLTSNPESHKVNEQRIKWFYEKYSHIHGSEKFEDVDRRKQIANSLIDNDIERSVEILQGYEEFQNFQPHELEDFAQKMNEEKKVKKNSSSRVFWYYDDGKLKIDLNDLFTYINDLGYYIYYPAKSPDNYKLVHLANGIIRYVDTREIKTKVLDFVIKENNNAVFNILNDRTKYWSEKFLNVLPEINPPILRDSEHISYIPTKTGLYKITKDEIKKIDYADLTDGVVWDTQITDIDFEYKTRGGDYEKFVNHLSGGGDNYEVLKSIIGYLLHNYKDPANAKAVFLFDLNISQIDGEPEGGSGKSLLAEGLKKIREIAPILGDRVDFKKSFVFQEISESTQIAWVDEMPKNTDYQPFFGRLTNALPIEKKNQNVITLSNDKSPKFLFTQNFKPKGSSGSHKRRRIDFGVSNYYSIDHTPRNEFKRNFFTQWDKEEWDKFFTFFLDCLKGYLNTGVIKQSQSEHLEMATELGIDLADFFISDGNLNNIIASGYVNIRQLYDSFINEYETDMVHKQFIMSFRKVLRIKKLKFEEKGKGDKRIFVLLK